MIITDDLNIIDDVREATKTERSILRSKLMELALQVDKSKQPTIEITEELKTLPNLNANWVKAHMERVFTQRILPTKKQEEQQKHLVKGSSAIEEE